jgi:hypothetical protein
MHTSPNPDRAKTPEVLVSQHFPHSEAADRQFHKPLKKFEFFRRANPVGSWAPPKPPGITISSAHRTVTAPCRCADNVNPSARLSPSAAAFARSALLTYWD